jgi:TatA/E family protein of Tat protein translocase
MVVIFIVALVVFGPEKLPDLAKTAAKGLREFKRATEDLKSSWHEHMREAENPVNELKQTLQEATSDIEDASTRLIEESPAPAPAAPEETTPETKPDAN